jgi:hypothetical protein
MTRKTADNTVFAPNGEKRKLEVFCSETRPNAKPEIRYRPYNPNHEKNENNNIWYHNYLSLLPDFIM